MKLVNQSCKIIEQESGSQGVYRAIEQAGRTCYKSEDKATNTSAGEFVDRMINSKHYAMLEFGTVYLKQSVEGLMNQINPLTDRYKSNKYSKVITVIDDDYKINLGNTKFFYHTTYITTNLRVLVENDWLDDLQFMCEPTKYHEKRICVKFTCDRGISHELVRHRVFSFAQESTRFCNYTKDKFGNELTYIIPSWVHNLKEATLEELSKVYGDNPEKLAKINKYYSPDNYENDWVIQILDIENLYFALLKKWDDTDKRYKTEFRNNPLTPQEARCILPNCLKTEINMCGFTSDWEHVFKLRDNSHAHPDIQALMRPLHEEFKKKFKIK